MFKKLVLWVAESKSVTKTFNIHIRFVILDFTNLKNLTTGKFSSSKMRSENKFLKITVASAQYRKYISYILYWKKL